MRKIWHHYTKWEEYYYGMWNKVSRDEEDKLLPIAIEFTGDADRYGRAMMRVLDEWPISCEQNLSDSQINRRAWIGHAACCIAINCPEYVVRKAWWHLSEDQQREANAKADEAIRKWELCQVFQPE
jgi:hypothetical protein